MKKEYYYINFNKLALELSKRGIDVPEDENFYEGLTDLENKKITLVDINVELLRALKFFFDNPKENPIIERIQGKSHMKPFMEKIIKEGHLKEISENLNEVKDAILVYFDDKGEIRYSASITPDSFPKAESMWDFLPMPIRHDIHQVPKSYGSIVKYYERLDQKLMNDLFKTWSSNNG